ncbi:MAG: LLM class flavin-dependent oxidoreductase [Dehalococcoidia bacterium]|nr:LLM class flavin-dependent oxidoreductase [Dehalococcoidia bacterium]
MHAGVTNVEAFILARQTSKAKIVVLGNILPIWDDPLWLAEQLAMTDMISRGRLITGWVGGGGMESQSHSANTMYNRERFEEVHDFIVKTWTTPGPFRWEGKHYHFRYVNPWCLPLEAPPPDVDPRCGKPHHREVGSGAPLPVRDAGDAARAHQGDV